MREVLSLLLGLVSSGVVFMLLYAVLVYYPFTFDPLVGWLVGGFVAGLIMFGYIAGLIERRSSEQ